MLIISHYSLIFIKKNKENSYIIDLLALKCRWCKIKKKKMKYHVVFSLFSVYNYYYIYYIHTCII